MEVGILNCRTLGKLLNRRTDVLRLLDVDGHRLELIGK
jgi:hypothetical protein